MKSLKRNCRLLLVVHFFLGYCWPSEIIDAEKVLEVCYEPESEVRGIRDTTEDVADMVKAIKKRNQTETTNNTYNDLQRNFQTRYSATVIVDLRFLVDVGIYQHFLKKNKGSIEDAIREIREYYAFVVDAADTTYKREFDGRIRLKLAKIEILRNKYESPLRWYFYNTGDFGLELGMGFLKQYKLSTAIKYDISIFFTVLYLSTYRHGIKVRDRTLGATYRGNLCNKQGYGHIIVKEGFNQRTVWTFLHELAHSLGSEHDGTENTIRCSQQDNFIMQPGNIRPRTNREHANRWKFSPCSLESIARFISVRKTSHPIRWKCLYETSSVSSEVPDVSGRRFGQVYTTDGQCKLAFGEDSSNCQLLTKDNPCMNLWCEQKSFAGHCVRLYAQKGTKCKNHWICLMGMCEPPSHPDAGMTTINTLDTSDIPSNAKDSFRSPTTWIIVASFSIVIEALDGFLS